MDFSRRSAQSCSCHGTADGAAAGSSPMRANDAMNAPPRATPKTDESEGRSNPAYQLHVTALIPVTCTASPLRSDESSSNIGTIDYRCLDAGGQRVRCRPVNAELSNRNSSGRFQRPLNQHAQRLRQRLALLLRDGGLLAK